MEEPLNDPVDIVLSFREASKVERAHTLPHHGSYSVGHHSHDCLSLLFLFNPSPSVTLIKAVHWHDAHERWVGDVPRDALGWDNSGDFLKGLKSIRQAVDKCLHVDFVLTDTEKVWLYAVDSLEFFLWCHDQLGLGNQYLGPPLKRVKKMLTENIPASVEFGPMLTFISEYKWRKQD